MSSVLAVPDQAPLPSEKTGEHGRPRTFLLSAFKHWAREPLLHFLLLGLALFAVYSYLQRGHGGVESSKQIALTLDDLRQMDMYFESQWHRPPAPQEFQAMVEDKVREEVLYREGIAMGLDKDDTIVKTAWRRRCNSWPRMWPPPTSPRRPNSRPGTRRTAKNSPFPAVPRSGICSSLLTAEARARMTTR